MKQAAAVGVPPHRFWKYTLRELFAVFHGAAIADARNRQLAVFEAWHTEAYARTKKLPPLTDEIRRYEPGSRVRTMDNKSLRAAIIAAATMSGANVIRKERG